MRFSILVPVYNAEKYLPAAVDSVRAQRVFDWELVLVNDGSTDACPALCDRYRKEDPDRVRVIHQKNGGLLSARRAGIAAARGDYCLFLDADDVLTPTCLETLSAALSAHDFPDIVIYNLFNMSNAGEPGAARKPVFPHGRLFVGAEKREIYRELIRTTYLNPLVLKLIRREIIQSDPTDYTPFFANSYGEDILQSLYPLTAAETVLYLSDALYGYRLSDISMIHSFSPASLDKRFNEPLICEVERYMEKWGLDDERSRTIYRARVYKTMMENMLFFMADPKVKKEATAYAVSFIAAHPDIRRVARGRGVAFFTRAQLFLFSHRRFGCLTRLRSLFKKH